MPLEKKEDSTKSRTITARLSESQFEMLVVLAEAFNMTRTEVIETLIQDGFKDAEKKYAADLKRARKSVKEGATT